MVTRKTKIANKQNYGGTRNLSNIKYIVIHYTANDGDKDEGNGNYFANNIVKASAHYFVDSDSITQSVPDKNIAYSVGAKTYKHAVCRNANSISIELCDDIKNGKIYPSQATINNAITLTKELMNKYNIPQKNVIRHYDVTGKACPAYWCGTTAKNNLWKTEFWNKLTKVEDDEVITKTKINLNGVVKTVNTIKKDGHNYIKLRDLADNKITIDYQGMPVVKVK